MAPKQKKYMDTPALRRAIEKELTRGKYAWTMPKRLLELFSGTHSIGKVAHKRGYEVYSLDRDLGSRCPFSSGYKADKHFKEDIMTWDYKQYPRGYFDIITASPVCLWWSKLQHSWIGRKKKGMDRAFTMEDINENINKYGKPMVDKVREIIDYFKPKHWWIENPRTGKMKTYITDLNYYDVDYCKYSNWGYKKSTRFWTNIEGFKPKVCKKDCVNMVGKKHKATVSRGNRKLERYRIPERLIKDLLSACK